ncbi:MAG: glycosyltransferase [Thermosphaera sp.]
MRVAIVTSDRSVSLQGVASTIGRVLEGRGASVKLVLSPVMSSATYEGVEGAVVVMTFDPIWATPYFSLAWLLEYNGIRTVFYTTIEGRARREVWHEWIYRDLSFVANSRYTARKLGEEGARVLGVVHHGIFTEEVAAAREMGRVVRRELGFGEEDVVVGYLAGGYVRKGHREFAEVIRIVGRKAPDVKFVVVTQPSAASFYSGLDNCVVLDRFGGVEREWVYGFYHALDVYAHPALGEGFGLPVLEALAAGKPVVHADYDPLSEITTKECSFRVRVTEVGTYSEGGGIRYELHFFDHGEFADAIIAAVDEVRRRGDELRAQCLERAKAFHARKKYNMFARMLRM